MNKFRTIHKKYKESKKSSFAIYITLRILVIACMILQLLRGEYENAFVCLLSLILFTLPIIIQDKFKIELPNTLEIIIYFFIFSAEILGEIYDFYGSIQHWDTILHTINGFICAGIGFALFDLLNKNSKNFNLSPFYITLMAFCFSMTVGVCWEFFEYALDMTINTNTQKDDIVTTVISPYLNKDDNKSLVIDNINKTIIYDSSGNELAVIDNGYLDIGLNDTIVNFIGAFIFSIMGYFYIKNKEKYKFTENFIPKKL